MPLSTRLLWLLLILAPRVQAAPSTAPAQGASPTLITMHLKNATPQAIFAELGTQGRCLFLTNPADLFTHVTRPQSIDLDDQPFWSATRTLCERTGLYPTLVDRKKLVLSQGNRGWMDGPTVVSGPFLILAVQGARSSTVRFGKNEPRRHELTIQLAALPEPSLRVLKGARVVKLEEATDEQGRSLLPNNPPAEAMTSGGPFAWSLEAKLRFPGQAGQRIARLRGTCRFAVQSAAEPWNLPNILTVANASRTVGQHVFRVLELKKTPDALLDPALPPDAEPYTLRLAISTAGRLDVEAIQQLIHPANLRLTDATGRPLVFRSWTRLVERGQVQYVFQFLRCPEGPNPTPDPPAHLTWEIPTQTQELLIPFDFTNLPMP